MFCLSWSHALRFALFAALICAAGSARADERLMLEWREVEARIDSLPDLSLARLAEVEARGESAAVRQWPNPEVGFELGRSEAREGTESDTIWGAEIEIALPSPWRRAYESDAADAGIEAAEKRREAIRREVLRRARLLYWTVGLHQELVRIERESMAQLQRLLEVAERRIELGEARPMERPRLEAERARAEQSLADAVSELNVARHRLRILLDRDLPETYDVAVASPQTLSLPEHDAALAAMQTTHPALDAANAQVARSRALVDAARAARWPGVRVGAFQETELDARSYGGRIGLELPLWNWKKPQIEIARARAEASEHEARIARRDLQLAFEEAWHGARRAHERWERLESEIAPLLRRNVDNVETMYRVGELGLLETLDSERALIAVSRELAHTAHEYRTAWAALRQLTGETR